MWIEVCPQFLGIKAIEESFSFFLLRNCGLHENAKPLCSQTKGGSMEALPPQGSEKGDGKEKSENKGGKDWKHEACASLGCGLQSQTAHSRVESQALKWT